MKLTWRSPGSEADIRYQNEVGDCEFKWMREYGSVWCRTGCFGVSTTNTLFGNSTYFLLNSNESQRDHLMVADPKALQYLLHMTGYRYPKSADRAHFNEIVVGKGLVSVQGWYLCMNIKFHSSIEQCRRSTSPSAEGHSPCVQRTAITIFPSFVQQGRLYGSTFGRLPRSARYLITIYTARSEMDRGRCR
jgi:hypothetical protein